MTEKEVREKIVQLAQPYIESCGFRREDASARGRVLAGQILSIEGLAILHPDQSLHQCPIQYQCHCAKALDIDAKLYPIEQIEDAGYHAWEHCCEIIRTGWRRVILPKQE